MFLRFAGSLQCYGVSPKEFKLHLSRLKCGRVLLESVASFLVERMHAGRDLRLETLQESVEVPASAQEKILWETL